MTLLPSNGPYCVKVITEARLVNPGKHESGGFCLATLVVRTKVLSELIGPFITVITVGRAKKGD